MDITIRCSECGVELDIDEEYGDYHGYHITVKPCEYCIKEAVDDAVIEAEREWEQENL